MPSSTYRIQLHRDFDFARAAALVDYLDELGISDCYVSPILQARWGSRHGYDLIDPSEVNRELGGEDGLRRFSAALRRRGMGLIADIVPNHMCVADPGNRWWWDVLENGPASPYARVFDIDWDPPEADLKHRVLLPILPDQFGRVLEGGQIQLGYEGGAFRVNLGVLWLPTAPRSWPMLLLPVAERVTQSLGAAHPDVVMLESILTALSYLPERTETDPERVRERLREKEVIKGRLAALVEASPSVAAALRLVLAEFNGAPGDPRSFDALERFLNEQGYRLAHWRVATAEINYRRFFDINELAAIHMEDPAVFEAVHAKVLELVRQGHIQGFRVDHPDGLFEPESYFQRLQTAVREARRDAAPDGDDAPFFVVAEKILVGDEQLRDWEIEGTTGYGFLNCLNGLFVDTSRKDSFTQRYRRLTGWSQSVPDLIYESKRLIMQVAMSGELNMLARRLDAIAGQHRWSRDFTAESLRDALREVVACFPIYRTYIRCGDRQVGPEDRRHILAAVAAARRRNPAVSQAVFDFLESVLVLDDPDGITEEQRAERRLFVLRLQQYTAPVLAKGLEDTAFYRYCPLASLNEVGGDMEHFGEKPAEFHRKNLIRQRAWPNALLATSTHDSKWSEDVRARLNVLSEMPERWFAAVARWRRMNQRWRSPLGGEEVPDANVEYLFYQALAGIWPQDSVNGDSHELLTARMQAYIEKAVREAKRHTSWIMPNRAYEDAVRRFVAGVLEPSAENRFLADFAQFHRAIAPAGLLNSLAQLVLKMAAPGVPDFYQGTEMWSFNLVDPDNRRPVDYARRRRWLHRLREAISKGETDLVSRLLENPADGSIKLYMTHCGLRFRRAFPELFACGAYAPLRAVGSRSRHVVSFGRRRAGRVAVAVAGRFFLRLDPEAGLPLEGRLWSDTLLVLRRDVHRPVYCDLFTGRVLEPVRHGNRMVLPLADLLSPLPAALLCDPEDRRVALLQSPGAGSGAGARTRTRSVRSSSNR